MVLFIEQVFLKGNVQNKLFVSLQIFYVVLVMMQKHFSIHDGQRTCFAVLE